MSSCIAVHIGLHLWLAAVAAAQPSSPKTFVMLQKHKVAVPQAAPDSVVGQGFFVSATAPALHAALAQAALVAAHHGSQSAGVAPVYRWRDKPPEGVRWQQLRVQRLDVAADDRPLWWLAPAAATDGVPAAACEAAANEPWWLFDAGLAATTWLPILGAAAPGPGLAQALPWVMLRHAASELPTPGASVDAAAAGQAPACAAHRGLPAPVTPVADVASSVLWHSAAHGKRVALTFDACSTYGYGPFNPAVIAALRANQVPATLFVGGHWAELHAAELEALAQDPLFEIGNHTYSHPHMRDLTAAQQQQQLLWTQEIIYARTGVVPRMFRPPYGEVDDALLTQVAQAGMYTVEYDLPAGDADVHVSPARLRHWVVDHATAGSIVIMHMNRPKNHTAEALPDIVADLRRRGFSFCQMSDLLLGDGSGCK